MMKANYLDLGPLGACLCLLIGQCVAAQTVSGTINDIADLPLQNVRVTLYNSDTTYFNEDRTDALGAYVFNSVPAGSYLLNASRADLAYARVAIATDGVASLVQDLTVSPQARARVFPECVWS